MPVLNRPIESTTTSATRVPPSANTTAWEREIGPFDYPLCSDFWPHGEVSRKYAVLREQEPFAGASERAIFVVGKNGRIEFSKIYSIAEAPELDDVFTALSRTTGAR